MESGDLLMFRDLMDWNLEEEESSGWEWRVGRRQLSSYRKSSGSG